MVYEIFSSDTPLDFSDVGTTLILRCQSHQPKVNVKPTLKQRRNFKSNRRTLYRRCFDVWMLTMNQRSQNDVRITLISRCRRCQPIFNQISTSKRRRMPAGNVSNFFSEISCVCLQVWLTTNSKDDLNLLKQPLVLMKLLLFHPNTLEIISIVSLGHYRNIHFNIK